MNAAVFLDRDGTLIEEKSYLTKPEQVRLLPGVPASLARLRAAGFRLIVVTNQSALGRGMMTEADLELVHAEMLRQLRDAGVALDAIYHCPLAPTTKDDSAIEHPDRKPGPGMLLRGASEHGVDLAKSWMVGDSVRDLLAGRNAGCRGGLLVRTGHVWHAAETLHLGANEHLVDDFAAATDVILASA